jgi:NADH:ubiquinone oxidoreductase subunit
MNLSTRLFTWLKGRRVGADGDGNTYYEERTARRGLRQRRWVVYKGRPEATKVPPEWNAWLRYTTETPLPVSVRQPWQKPHVQNATGTPAAYRPPGHDYLGGQRARATGDYEAWTPGS